MCARGAVHDILRDDFNMKKPTAGPLGQGGKYRVDRILTFVLALAVCGMAALCVYCYRLGLRDGGFARRNGGVAAAPASAKRGRRRKGKRFRARVLHSGTRPNGSAPQHGGPRDGEAARAQVSGPRAAALHSRPRPGTRPRPAGAQGWRADKYDAILANIDAYDGTEKGQKVIE